MAKKADIKTKENNASVKDFIESVENEQKRADCYKLIELMEKASGAKAKMWGPAIIGFGNRVAKSPTTGREVDWLVIGFSPRKANLSLYLSMNLAKHAETLSKLGKHKTSVGCLYINKLADVDMKVLEELIRIGVKKYEL